MQKLAIAAALTVVSLATLHEASAAELPAPPPRARPVYTPPPPPPPVFSWTGFYIGGNGGGGSFHNDFNGTQTGATTFTGIPGSFPSTTSFGGTTGGIGGILGGQIGFNYEFPLSHWVIGVEADGDWSNIAGTNTGCSTFTSGAPLFAVGSTAGCATVNSRLDSFETVRGRVGYAFDTGSYTFPSVLVYATGGGAWGQVDGNNITTCLGATCPGASAFPFSGGSATFSHGESGWTAGAGFEWAFFQHWTARIEYLHLQFPNGSTNFTTTTAFGGAFPGTVTSTTHISTNVGVDVVRFGVNYLFNFGGPAYAY
jgi:outer membrane immunogenic protein